MKKFALPISLLMFGGALSAHAAEPFATPVDSLSELALQEVVVTGTRTPKLLKDTPVQTRLIRSEDIKAADATTLQDLLQAELPGVEFTYAMNQQVNMNMAGFAGQSVLILVDGERLAGETMENVDFSRLLMAQVDRIEIVKGASSALYGSNAAGGVINIITRKADKKWRANVNARAADHNEWRLGANASVASTKIDNMLDISYSTIDTYTVCLNPNDECDYRNVFGHKVWNFSDKLSYRPLQGLELTGRAGYFFKERYYNPDTPDRYRDFSASLKGDWKIAPASHLTLSYAFDQYDKSDLIKSNGLDIRDYRNVQHTVRALFDQDLTASLHLTAGADYMHDYLDTYQFKPGEYRTQVNVDMFAQGDWEIDPHWEVIGALRYDWFSDAHRSQVTYKLSGRYRYDYLTLRAGYASGFRAPTLKEMYMNFNMAGIFDIHGNPDLECEKSQNVNFSAEYSWKNYNFTLGANYTFVNDKISTSGVVYDANDEPFIRYINVHRLKVLGCEATASAHWAGGFSARLSYAYTHEQSVGNAASQYCPARPHALNVRGAWHHEWAKAYATELIVSGRFLSAVSYKSMYLYEPFLEKTVHNPAYTLWKVQLNQVIMQGVTLSLAVDNIFNYAPAVYSFNAPVTLGANLMVGLSIDLDRLL